MVSLRVLALLGAATLVSGQTVDTLRACAQECYQNMANGVQFGCAANDLMCYCPVFDFHAGIRDCAKAKPDCGEAYEADVVNAVINKCNELGAPIPAGVSLTQAPEPTATPSPETPPAPSSTAPVTSSPTPETTSEASPSVTPSTSSASTLSTAITSSTSAASTDGPIVVVPVPSSTSSSETTTTSSASSATPTTDGKHEEASGLSTGAKAGIGIGVGIGAVVLIAGGIWACLRHRQNKRDHNGFIKQHFQISDPLPGSGRSYASDQHDYETGLSELEMKSRRYEDMIPRAAQQPAQQPLQMV